MITLEDIVEEVLGEIRDPFDNEKNLINKIKNGVYMVDAKISIYDLEEALHIDFPKKPVVRNGEYTRSFRRNSSVKT